MSELHITVLRLPGSNPFWKAQLFAKLALNFKALKHLGDYTRPDILKWKKVELCVQERCLGIGWEFARFLRDCGESLARRGNDLRKMPRSSYVQQPPTRHTQSGPGLQIVAQRCARHLQTEDGRGPQGREFLWKVFLVSPVIGPCKQCHNFKKLKKRLILLPSPQSIYIYVKWVYQQHLEIEAMLKHILSKKIAIQRKHFFENYKSEAAVINFSQLSRIIFTSLLFIGCNEQKAAVCKLMGGLCRP